MVPGTGDAAENGLDQGPALMNLTIQWTETKNNEASSDNCSEDGNQQSSIVQEAPAR